MKQVVVKKDAQHSQCNLEEWRTEKQKALALLNQLVRNLSNNKEWPVQNLFKKPEEYCLLFVNGR